MRIEHALRALVAVLRLAVLIISASCYVSSNSQFAPQHLRHSHKVGWGQNLTLREKQLFILQESAASKHEDGVGCCPQVMEMTEPDGGMDLNGVYVKLYRDDVNRQRFYEYSCADDVVSKPCRFLDKKLYNQSRCEQEHSYVYALIEANGTHSSNREENASMKIMGHTAGNTNWMLGYIKIRTGCRCKLYPKQSKKKSKNKRLHHRDGPT